jgi:hypothetical protein
MLTLVRRPTFTRGNRRWYIHLRIAAGLHESMLAASLTLNNRSIRVLLRGPWLATIFPELVPARGDRDGPTRDAVEPDAHTV